MKNTTKALMQTDTGYIFGIGQTEEEAEKDALKWTDTLDGLVTVEITDELAKDIEDRGGQVRNRQREDGRYDVPFPSHTDFIEALDESGLSDRDLSLGLSLHENYLNRMRRGDVEYRPVYYYAIKGLLAE